VREVIEKMLEVERRARRLVAQAEAEAVRLTDDARAEARQTVERARQEALAQVGTIVAEAVATAEKDKAAQLAEARRRFESEKATNQEQVPQVAGRLLPLLLKGATSPATPSAAAPEQTPSPEASP